MNPPEAIEQWFIKRLDPHRDSIYSELPQQPRFFERNSRRVAFDGPFLRSQKLKPLHRTEDFLPLPQTEQRGRSTSKKHGFWPAIVCDHFQFANQPFDVGIDQDRKS